MAANTESEEEKPTTGQGKPADSLPPEIQTWLGKLDLSEDEADYYPPGVHNRLVYVLIPNRTGKHVVKIFNVRLLKTGGWSDRPAPFDPSQVYRSNFPAYVRPSDISILRDLNRLPGPTYQGIILSGTLGRQLMAAMIATKRFRLHEVSGLPIIAGPPREGQGQWDLDEEGNQNFRFVMQGPGLSFPFDVPWYLDTRTGECGPVQSRLPDRTGAALMTAPILAPDHAPRVRDELVRRFPDRPDLWPKKLHPVKTLDIEPVPVVSFLLVNLEAPSYYSHLKGRPTEIKVLAAHLSFRYGSKTVRKSDSRSQVAFLEGDQPYRFTRKWESEYAWIASLERLGWSPFELTRLKASYSLPKGHGEAFVFMESSGKPAGGTLIERFLAKNVPALVNQGWQVDLPREIAIPTVAEDAVWHIEATEGASADWFGLNLGVEFEDGRINLMPILLGLLRRLSRAEIEAMGDAAPDDTVIADREDGSKISLPVHRVYPLLQALYELYDGAPDPNQGLHRAKAIQLAELEDLSWLSWQGSNKVKTLAERLSGFKGIEPLEPPEGFRAELRPYQKEGLGWLRFLREYDFGGVLADDMGLGKTVQALAHILAEKKAGRLTRPCLVVAPTSLMANWRMEAAKFAPELDVLTLHGADRRESFAQILKHDLVLTTYPLLGRDAPFLLQVDFELVILDEAQNIKNSKSIMAQTAYKLKARSRLCLTGTPLENHLGELWSIFRFLMPGFLGTDMQFRKRFQTPIEKDASSERRAILSKRLAPFMIRRTKEQVASELPPKTDILEPIELEGSQRDLYESVRLAMDERVSETIRAKGVAKSHLVILDALLKLRQVCCDPRLLKLEEAQRVKESAKLERLMEMLPEMVAEGRRILVFSQFTSMLALIETELRRENIPYALLTGETEDRPAQIERFQEGHVPVFLISLKAGGTGLNLTAADTVIHYDPWWNPAAEAQATDRAHRIGQTKNVFVYRLIALGTVEERISELQESKRQLAAGIFSDDADAPGSFDEEALLSLLRSPSVS